MRFSVLSSGSKANSTFVEAGQTRILIDCGLSGRQAELRLLQLGIDPHTIDAIIVTHEHSDHINGIKTFAKRFGCVVYGNKATLSEFNPGARKEIFVTGQEFQLGDLQISPFSIVHDALDPVGFAIHNAGFKFVYATDLGRVTNLVSQFVLNANALVLESNHDQEMLQTCDYTWQLKQRIASTHGHLCNDAAGQLLFDSIHPELLHVVLGHLSENSNTPDLALTCAKKYVELSEKKAAGLQTLMCGNVYSSTPLFECDVEKLDVQRQALVA